MSDDRLFLSGFNQVNVFRENMTFEEEFFEMAQALEENSEMLNVSKKLSEPQVESRFNLIFNFSSLSTIETCPIAFNTSYPIIEKSRTTNRIEFRCI